MKKLLLSAVVLITITANAQKINETDVPTLVKAAFAKQYVNVKVKIWEKESGNFEAAFGYQRKEMSVLIDEKGNILETETEIAVSELPAVVMDYCTKNYVGKKITEASKIVDAKGVMTYEAEIEKMDVIFDAKGNFVKEEKD